MEGMSVNREDSAVDEVISGQEASVCSFAGRGEGPEPAFSFGAVAQIVWFRHIFRIGRLFSTMPPPRFQIPLEFRIFGLWFRLGHKGAKNVLFSDNSN